MQHTIPFPYDSRYYYSPSANGTGCAYKSHLLNPNYSLDIPNSFLGNYASQIFPSPWSQCSQIFPPEKMGSKTTNEKHLSDWNPLDGGDGSSAYLGPQLWEKNLPCNSELKLELDDFEELLNDNVLENVLQKSLPSCNSNSSSTCAVSSFSGAFNSSQSDSISPLSSPNGSIQDTSLNLPSPSERRASPNISNGYQGKVMEPMMTPKSFISDNLSVPIEDPFKTPPNEIQDDSMKTSEVQSFPDSNSTFQLLQSLTSPVSSKSHNSDSEEDNLRAKPRKGHSHSKSSKGQSSSIQTRRERSRRTSKIMYPDSDSSSSSSKGRKRNTSSSSVYNLDESSMSSIPLDESLDPRLHPVPEEHLKIQFVVHKSKKQYVPSDLKDERYWARRHKNNLAAKRSRNARRVKENFIVQRAGYLEQENLSLKEELEETKSKLEMLTKRLSKYESP